MRIVAVFVTILGLLTLARASPRQQAKPYPVDLETVTDMMAGDYIIVGKKPDSKTTYSGRMTFRVHGKKLDFTRTVNGRADHGTAIFDTVAGDRIPVMRMRFAGSAKALEGTYQWSTDCDNYIRFTGYVYAAKGNTKVVGLEMLFPLAPTLRD